MAERQALRLQIHGIVQGVFFRAWTVDKARTLGVNGWVRNRHDGAVEALISGEPAALTAMLAALRRGPPNAQVEMIEEFPALPSEAGTGFRQLPSA